MVSFLDDTNTAYFRSSILLCENNHENIHIYCIYFIDKISLLYSTQF